MPPPSGGKVINKVHERGAGSVQKSPRDTHTSVSAFSQKSPTFSPKNPYTQLKDPYILSTEPYNLSKNTYTQTKEPTFCRKAQHSLQKSPIITRKSPEFSNKNSPLFWKWCNLNLEIISLGSRTRDFTVVGRYNYRYAVNAFIRSDERNHGVAVVIPTNHREIPGSTPRRYNLQIKITSESTRPSLQNSPILNKKSPTFSQKRPPYIHS